MKQIGIYKYENKINGKIYIGQSVNIKVRYAQHLYDAHTLKTSSLLAKAIHKYGIENFTFEIIELCSKEQLNEREIYWISYYDSYRNGYNNTPGGKSLKGENHPRALVTEEDVWLIRELYNSRIPRKEAFTIFDNPNITQRGFKKIWDGENWSDVHMDVYTEANKQWHSTVACGHSEDQYDRSSLDRALKQDEIDMLVKDYNSGLNIHQLTKKYNRDYGVIQKYLSNPVEITQVKYRGRTVKNINTGL